MAEFQKLFDESPGSYLILDSKLNILDASEEYQKQTLTKLDEIRGRYVFDVFPQDESGMKGKSDLEHSFEYVIHMRKPHVMKPIRYDIRRPVALGGGFEARYWQVVNTPVCDSQRNLKYIINEVQDVTSAMLVKQDVAISRAAAMKKILCAQVVLVLAVAAIAGVSKAQIDQQQNTLDRICSSNPTLCQTK